MEVVEVDDLEAAELILALAFGQFDFFSAHFGEPNFCSKLQFGVGILN